MYSVWSIWCDFQIANFLCFNWPIAVHSLSIAWYFVTPWTTAHQDSLSSTISLSLFKLLSIESVMPSNHLILFCPILLLPSIFPSFRGFFQQSALSIRWPKVWSFSFSISPSSEYSGLVFFWIDCLDLLAVQGTLNSLLQHHNSKASFLWHLTFFMVQLSHLYMTAGKSVAWTIRIFVSKVMSVLFNMLSCFVIAFLPRSKRLFNVVAAVTICSDFRAQENKVCHCFRFPPSICHEMMGLDVMTLAFWMLSFKPTFWPTLI